jgi:hypothetical protein
MTRHGSCVASYPDHEWRRITSYQISLYINGLTIYINIEIQILFAIREKQTNN